MTKTRYTRVEILALIERSCKEAGGQKAWAEAIGVSQAYVSDVLARKRNPGDKILDALGLRMVPYYEVVD